MKRGKPMKRTPMKRTGRLRSRRRGHGGTVAGRENVSPARWQEISEQVKERHGHRCCVPWCRSRRPLDVHHVVKRSAGGADDPGNPMAGEPGNLIPLCRHCHEATDFPTSIRLVFAPVSSDPPLACGFYVHGVGALIRRSGFIALLAGGGATHESF